MTILDDAEIEAIKKRLQEYYEIDEKGNLTFTLQGARDAKPFYEFVGIKISSIKTLSDLKRADDIVFASLPEYFTQSRKKKGRDHFEIDALEAAILASEDDAKKALDRLKTRQKLTIISNYKR